MRAMTLEKAKAREKVSPLRAELLELVLQLPLDKRYRELLAKGVANLSEEQIQEVIDQLKTLS